MSQIPQLSKRCRVCHHENKYAIQKDIDNGESSSSISEKYNISTYIIKMHIINNHRTNLLAVGAMDYVIRKKSIDVGLILVDYIEKWSQEITKRTSTIRDNDALKALELLSKIQGTLINKHEIVVKKSIEDVLCNFLSDDETQHSEVAIISETAKS